MSSVADLWTLNATTASPVNVTEAATDVTAMTNVSQSTSEAPVSANNVTDRHHRTGIDVLRSTLCLGKHRKHLAYDKRDATFS